MAYVFVNGKKFRNIAEATTYINERTDFALATRPDDKKVKVAVDQDTSIIDENIRLSFSTTLENK